MAHNLLITQSDIVSDLQKIGVQKGMTLMVHSSLKSLGGWVCGGAEAVVLALQEAIGQEGTLVMPAFTANNTDPAMWSRPPVPTAWWPKIREQMPPFRPDMSVTRAMGAIPECFRKQNGTLRSNHPVSSFIARGKYAKIITKQQTLGNCFGEDSPLGKLYQLETYVLLIGVGYDNNTSLHLCEAKANYKSKYTIKQGSAILENGQRKWVVYEEIDWNSDDFVSIGKAFETTTNQVKIGNIAQAETRLMSQASLVDFGVQWMENNR